MGTRTMNWVFLLPFFAITMANGEYTEETPLKMLDVRSVATRYPASNSEYRTNLENGYVSILALSKILKVIINGLSG